MGLACSWLRGGIPYARIRLALGLGEGLGGVLACGLA